MKMEQTECSEMLAYKIKTPGNYPKESIQHGVVSYERPWSCLPTFPVHHS